jgi:hypothetical protein
MEGAVVTGVIAGTATEPRVRWLERPLAVTPELLRLSAPVAPDEVFRFAGRCVEHDCQHFHDDRCALGAKLATSITEGVQMLPTCPIRRSCRWFAEQGRTACAACSSIVTLDYGATPERRRLADPQTDM